MACHQNCSVKAFLFGKLLLLRCPWWPRWRMLQQGRHGAFGERRGGDHDGRDPPMTSSGMSWDVLRCQERLDVDFKKSGVRRLTYVFRYSQYSQARCIEPNGPVVQVVQKTATIEFVSFTIKIRWISPKLSLDNCLMTSGKRYLRTASASNVRPQRAYCGGRCMGAAARAAGWATSGARSRGGSLMTWRFGQTETDINGISNMDNVFIYICLPIFIYAYRERDIETEREKEREKEKRRKNNVCVCVRVPVATQGSR